MCSFSSENRPPLPPRKSDERLSPRLISSKTEDDKPKPVEKKPSPEVGTANKPAAEQDDPWKTGNDKLNATGSSTSVASSMDDTPMLQRLKDMNKK